MNLGLKTVPGHEKRAFQIPSSSILFTVITKRSRPGISFARSFPMVLRGGLKIPRASIIFIRGKDVRAPDYRIKFAAICFELFSLGRYYGMGLKFSRDHRRYCVLEAHFPDFVSVINRSRESKQISIDRTFFHCSHPARIRQAVVILVVIPVV